MGKKYSKAHQDKVNAEIEEEIRRFVEGEQEVEEETPVEEVNEEPEEVEEEIPVIEIEEEPEEEKYEIECNKMLDDIKDVKDLDEVEKRLKNLEIMSRITENKRKERHERFMAYRRAMLEEQKAEDERIARERELEIQKESLKVQKRSSWLTPITSIVINALSFIGMGALMRYQNRAELGLDSDLNNETVAPSLSSSKTVISGVRGLFPRK